VPVSVARWAGKGAIRYIPEYLLERIDEIVSYSDCVRRQREVEVVDPEPLVKISEKKYDVGSRFDLDKYVSILCLKYIIFFALRVSDKTFLNNFNGIPNMPIIE